MLWITIGLGVGLAAACLQLVKALLRARKAERLLQDSSAQLAAQTRLFAAERRQRIMEACANAVSLEINNPLTSVLGLTRILASNLREKGAEPRHLEMLDAIEAEAQRMRSITRLVLGFVQSRPAAAPVSVNDTLATVLDIFEPLAKEVFVTVVKKLEPSLPPIHGSASDLEQGFAHLINDICLGQVGPADLVIKTSFSGLKRVEIAFEFNHTGLSDAAAKPFMSPFGRGSEHQKAGLGLAIAKRVASEHHGEVRTLGDAKQKNFVVVLPASASQGAKQDTGS